MPRRRQRPPSPPTTLEGQLRRMRKELPNIRPFQEEEDLNWLNDGLDALQADQLQRAEKILKKLTVAQPEHFDGYYGLAQVYQRQQLIPQAILFADEAIRLAQAFLDDGSLDPIGMQELQDFGLDLSRLLVRPPNNKKPPSLKAAVACAPFISARSGRFLLN